MNMSNRNDKSINPAEIHHFSFSPFAGFSRNDKANKAVVNGAQKKAPFTGMYTEISSGDVYYIKKSEKYSADDDVEVMASRLLQFLGANAAPCKFVTAANGEQYVASKCFDGYQALLTPGEKSLANGWLGSNPISDKNKKKLDNKFKTSLERQDQANNLVAGAIVKDGDGGQPGNACFYQQAIHYPNQTAPKVKRRVGKIDHGWSLAEICKNLNKPLINIYEVVSPVAQKATHDFGGVPTNHLKNWLKIIESPYFIKAAFMSAKKADEKGALEREVTIAINEVLRPKDTPEKQKLALHNLAKHFSLSIPKNLTKVEDIKKYMSKTLSTALKAYTDSLVLNAVLMQIKLKKDQNGHYLSPETRIKALKEVIEQRFAGRKVNCFMPDFEPSVKHLLTDLLGEAENVDPSLMAFCFEIKEGRNPVKRYTRASTVENDHPLQDKLNELKKRYEKNNKVQESAKSNLTLRTTKAMLVQFGRLQDKAKRKPLPAVPNLAGPPKIGITV